MLELKISAGLLEQVVAQDKNTRSLLGVGLDNQDGQVRITRGKNFHLVGGSEETHESMQEQCIKFNEKLDTRGKQLEELECAEFLELAAECRMNVVLPVRRERDDNKGGDNKRDD